MGGYQVAYMVTQSPLFAAGVAAVDKAGRWGSSWASRPPAGRSPALRAGD